jgi:uncharacterized membrane protein YphA (DoxX/SURF4 family)
VTVDVLRRWLPLLFRFLVIWQLAWPALSKFVTYGSRVEHFRHDYGIPFPKVMVPVVGTFEMVMLIASIFGLAGRFAAVPMLSIMPVAMATEGVNEGNVMVLIGSLGILLLGTGPLSLWDLRWSPPTRTAGYTAAALWIAIAIVPGVLGSRGTWGVRTVLGEGNSVPSPLVPWFAVGVPSAAALIVLGRMCVWGGRLPRWIFELGTWAITASLVLVSILNFAGGSSWEALFGAFALFFALLCTIVAASESKHEVDGSLSLEWRFRGSGDSRN